MQHCPICSSSGTPLAYGFKRCPQDGLVYFPQAKNVTYEADYFAVEYQAQYGRSYQADKSYLQQRMQQRLKKFLRYKKTVQPKERLLEVGSAYGFFLELASQLGFLVEGWEISATAAQVANQQGYFTRRGDFFTLYKEWQESKAPTFEVVAAFYTLEHFAHQRQFWQAVQNLVSKGGWLLLALPSTAGPLFYFHYEKWAQSHPIDHFVDYSPASLKKVAHSYGFQVLHASSEGIHPNRFPGGHWPGVKQFWATLQRLFPFSDTFYGILRKTI